jgi:ADP-L-glycero-D-manno-heptose 6-epimerase
MKILVTGHKGFIGQNMVQYLRENTDWEVDTYEWGEQYHGVFGYNWVIHMGAISSTIERDIEKVLKQNTDFTKQLIRDCRTFGVNLQFSSSASLYGLNKEFNEESPLDPITPYAWSKYLTERIIREHTGGNIIHCFRYFNVYGDHEEHKGTQASPVTQFRKQLKDNGIIKIFDGSNQFFRDFICVTDVCRIHVEFIKKVEKSGVFNVGTGDVYSFQQVADLITDKQTYIPMPEHLKRSYQEYTKADITKLESAIGPQKWISIKEFLESTINR